MSTIQINTPIVTIDEMQAIWDAQPESTLTLIDKRGKHAWEQPLHISHLPMRVGEDVLSKPALFRIDVKRAKVDRWQAVLFGGKRFLEGRIHAIHCIDGDSIECTLLVHGWSPS